MKIHENTFNANLLVVQACRAPRGLFWEVDTYSFPRVLVFIVFNRGNGKRCWKGGTQFDELSPRILKKKRKIASLDYRMATELSEKETWRRDGLY